MPELLPRMVTLVTNNCEDRPGLDRVRDEFPSMYSHAGCPGQVWDYGTTIDVNDRVLRVCGCWCHE